MRTKQDVLAVVCLLFPIIAAMGVLALARAPAGAVGQAPAVAPTWTQVGSAPMRGDYKAFWNVGGGDVVTSQ